MEWNRRHGVEVVFGTGKYGPLYLQARAATGELVKIASVRTYGYAIVNYGAFQQFPPFDRAEERVEVNRRLNRIPGVKITGAIRCGGVVADHRPRGARPGGRAEAVPRGLRLGRGATGRTLQLKTSWP